MANFFSRFGKKKPIPLEESIEKIQKGDKQLQNEMIEQYTPFIASTVSSVCKRYINEYDDEFSIGLIAFNEAIERFSPDKGKSILAFAETVIKSRVIDYIRKEKKNPDTIIFSTQELEFEEDGGEYSHNKIETERSIDEYNREIEIQQRKEELERFKNSLDDFGLKLDDLYNSAPKHIDARHNAIDVATVLIDNEELKNLFLTTRKLPIKDLDKKVNVSRKTIERNRKYIIALAIIINGDFKFLKDYLKK